MYIYLNLLSSDIIKLLIHRQLDTITKSLINRRETIYNEEIDLFINTYLILYNPVICLYINHLSIGFGLK